MLAVISSGHADLADVFFLCAVILAFVAAVVNVARSSPEGALLPAAVGFVALAFLIL